MTYRITKDKFLTNDEKLELTAKVALLGPRDASILFIGMLTGARASEILNIKLLDIMCHGHAPDEVYIRGLKGSDDRTLPLPKWLGTLIRLALVNDQIIPGPNRQLFNISYSRLVQIWGEVAPNKKPFKSLRHTFAIELYLQTKDIFLVKRALGHRCITNTMVYVDYILSMQHLQQLKKVNFYGLPRD